MNNTPYEKKCRETNRLKRWFIVLFICLIAFLGAAGYFYLQSLKGPSFVDDFSAKKGMLSSMSKDEIQALMNQTVKDGYVNVYINSNPIFENGDVAGNIYVQNVPANTYGYRVTISLKDTKEDVLHTGYIAPGFNVENHKLDKPLKKGVYPAVAKFVCFKSEKDKTPIAESDVNITLTVQN